MGERRTTASAPTPATCRATSDLPGRASARCRRTVGRSPARSSGRWRSGSRRARARPRASGSSCGHLVGEDVGPHLQAARRDVARAERRTATHSGEGRGERGGAHRRVRGSAAACAERRRHAGPRDHPRTRWPDGVDLRMDRRRCMPRRCAGGRRQTAPRSAAGAAAASATRPRSAELASSASGCHCTPSAKRWSGASIASGSSSSVAQPVTRSPSPAGRRPDGGGTWSGACLARATRAASEPPSSCTSWSAPSKLPGHAAVVLVAVALGQVLVQRAAESHVHDLHAAADARAPADRARSPARSSAISKPSRSGTDPTVCGCAGRAVGGGVDVGAAGQDQPVDQVEHLVGVLDQRRDRARAAAPGRRHAAPRRRSCAAAAPPPGPTRSSGRAPARCTGRSRDETSPDTVATARARAAGTDHDMLRGTVRRAPGRHTR